MRVILGARAFGATNPVQQPLRHGATRLPQSRPVGCRSHSHPPEGLPCMLKRHYHFATLIAFLGLTGLTGCQQPSAPPGATPKVAAPLPGITTPPACARLTATLDH